MTRWVALAMLAVGAAVAGAAGSINGDRHTAYRTEHALVQDLQALQGQLEACGPGDDEGPPAEHDPRDDAKIEACRAAAIGARLESGALQDGQSVQDALVAAEARAASVGLPAPGERFVQWAGRGGLGWLFGCGLILAGAVLARRQQAAEAAGDTEATEERVHFPAAVMQIRGQVEQLIAEIADLPMDDDAPEVRERLENLETDLLMPVVDARGQFIARHGIGGFAEYFSPFSAGERNLHRTWSALTDGHAVVARDALDIALRAFQASSEAWDAVEIRAGGHAWQPQPVAEAVPVEHAHEAPREVPLAARATVGTADVRGEDIDDDDTVGSERGLGAGEQRALAAQAVEGHACLEACGAAPEQDTPEAVVDAIRSAVDAYRNGAVRDDWADLDRAASALGALWGTQVAQTAGWVWVHLEAGGEAGVALVSLDRAHAVFPEAFLRAVIAEPERDNTVRLVFMMIRDAKVPDAPPGSRTVLS